MSLTLRVLLNRLRQTAALTVLRLIGLTLAVALAAAIPTFVPAAMDRVLQQEIQRRPDARSLVLGWSASDSADHTAEIAALESYLQATTGSPQRLIGSAPHPVQRLGENGQVQPGRRFLRLAALPAGAAGDEGLTLTEGRHPEPGQPEVVMLQEGLKRAGYRIGEQLLMPLPENRTVTLTIVGSVAIASDSPLAALSSTLESTLLTSPAQWEALSLLPGDASWTVQLTEFRAVDVPRLSAALERVPIVAAQLLGGAEVVLTPAVWMKDFARQMAATERFLIILLAPVFLLVLGFVFANASVLADGRRTEITVLRSRGATQGQILRFYLPESLLLAALGCLAGLGITLPLVRVMGLMAGFLQLVWRPPLPVSLSQGAILYAVAAAIAAEAVMLSPLVRAARHTIATIRQEAGNRSAVPAVLRVTGEILLVTLTAYGAWRLNVGVGPGGAPATPADPILLALPALTLLTAGALMLRLLSSVLALTHRLVRGWLSPHYYLTLSLLRTQQSRYFALALMLVVTSGLGVYGAAFARTLDRHLVARSRYQIGADLSIRAGWESDILSFGSNGEPVLAYREPPLAPMLDLPGTTAAARVQTRTDVSLRVGTRSLGQFDLVGITPREFGQVARFLPELTPNPGSLLNGLAADERGVILSAALAQRANLAPGDQLTVKQDDAETAMVVAGIAAYWPGRLPEHGEFLIANLPYLQDELGLEPYAFWYRFQSGGSAATAVAALQERGVRIAEAKDLPSSIAQGRRQPFRLGLYAALSVSYLAAIIVMSLTYLLSLGKTLQARAKELGVLRAMGMSARQVALALYGEQLTVVGLAAATGLLAGTLSAHYFVPGLSVQLGDTALPLQVGEAAADRLTVFLALLITLLVGVIGVAVWLKRLQLRSVLRLGEDG